MERPTGSRKEPVALAAALSQLFAMRGYGRVRGERQLHDIWKEIAGEQIALQTRVAGIKNGVLTVGVASAALMSELASFHKYSLLERLRAEHAHLKVNDLKFKLRGDLGRRT